MKIAILLLCHKNPQQINMLLDAMKNEAIEFFVHVDKKADIINQITHRKDIHFLPEEKRVSVTWGGWSIIQAELNLFRTAYSSGDYDYFWLCSGQDFPIKPVEQIVDFFRDHTDCDFVNLFQTANTNGGQTNKYDKRTSIKFPAAVMGISTTKRILKRLLVEVTGGYNHTFQIFRRKNTTGMKFYFGSQWVCFSQQTLRWVLQYISKHPEYSEYFRTVNTPDESYFHTLYMISPFAGERKDYLHYIDWSQGGNSPKTLTMDDYQNIKNSSYLMARKFDEGSFDLMQEIVKGLI